MNNSDKLFIQADLHCHSLASSHAYSTVNELAAAAAETGLEVFALTDHAMAMPDAPHVWHFHNLHVIPQKINSVTVLRGVEANIMNFDGDIDMTAEDLRCIQWVVASCHTPVIRPGSIDENTNAYINAVKKNPVIDVIGHCTAAPYCVDFDRLAKACSENGVFLELNESSVAAGRSTAENCIAMLGACKKYETQILVNTDCHYSGLIGRIPVSVKLLEEAEFPRELIFNRDAGKVFEYVSRKHNITL
ncbi:MAG: phosphatase [Porcipelethomonas sp.]